MEFKSILDEIKKKAQYNAYTERYYIIINDILIIYFSFALRDGNIIFVSSDSYADAAIVNPKDIKSIESVKKR